MKLSKAICIKALSGLFIAGICIAVLWMARTTSMSIWSISAPSPSGERYLDWHYEICIVSSALNWALPLGVISLLGSIITGIYFKNINFGMIAVAISALISISSCCIMFFQFIEYMHPGVDLWGSCIWWIMRK